MLPFYCPPSLVNCGNGTVYALINITINHKGYLGVHTRSTVAHIHTHIMAARIAALLGHGKGAGIGTACPVGNIAGHNRLHIVAAALHKGVLSILSGGVNHTHLQDGHIRTGRIITGQGKLVVCKEAYAIQSRRAALCLLLQIFRQIV